MFNLTFYKLSQVKSQHLILKLKIKSQNSKQYDDETSAVYLVYIIIQLTPNQMKKSQSLAPTQEHEVVLTQGIHFFNVQTYFIELLNNFCIFSWFTDHKNYTLTRRQIKPSLKQQTVSYIYGVLNTKEGKKSLIVREEKQLLENQIFYSWIEDDQPKPFEKKINFKVSLKIEVQVAIDGKNTYNLIKIIFSNYRQSEKTSLAFKCFSEKGKKVHGYKPNFCKYSKYRGLIYPHIKQANNCIEGKNKQRQLILLISQNNMKEIPFFEALVQKLIKSGIFIPKIIGHPLNLLLTFLIGQDHSFDQKIGQILFNYKKYELKRATKSNLTKQIIQQKLSSLLFNVLNQQNLLQPSFIQFFAQNLVNQSFQQSFIELIELYYKILLDQKIQKQQIKTAIAENFYVSQQLQAKNSTKHFTSLLKFIEFKHNMIVRDVLFAINKEIKHNQAKDIQQFTLLDLYHYNQIQYTFIGFDINDEVVRFFNYQTTPYMPISAILSLIQILPLPYKSVIWKQEWGKYKYSIDGLNIEISLSGNEIIDSKYILQCPLDLINDPYIRKCYFSNNTHCDTRIEAVTPLKMNVDDITNTDQLKTLLKAMKNNAIDSLPKIKLVWKILTTKNLVEIDVNNVKTLYQIPYLQKILKINQTSKNFLKNLNFQVNQQRIFTSPFPQYTMVKDDLVTISLKCQDLVHFLQDNFVKNISLFLQNKSALQMMEEIKLIGTQLKFIKNFTYQDAIWFQSKLKNLIKNYDLKNKFLYLQEIQNLNNKVENYQLLIDIKQIKDLIEQILLKLITAQLKLTLKEQEQDNHTNTRINETFNYVYQQEQKISVQNLVKEIKKFISQLGNTSNQLLKYKYSLQYRNLQFHQLTAKISNKIYQIMQRKIQTKQVEQLYSYYFQITPQLYNLKQVLYSKFYTHRLLRDFVKDNYKEIPIHMIIGGKDISLLTQAYQLLSIRNIIKENEMKPITKISSSGFHSVLAFLFCLNIDKETLISQIVGIETLIRIKQHIKNEENINIVELLCRTVDIQEKLYYFDTDKKIGQLRTKIHKTYSNIIQKFMEFQNSLEMGNHYKMLKFYTNIQKFDTFFVEQSLKEKQLSLTNYINEEMQKDKRKKRSQQILKQNQEMLKQKIILNKIGIKFLLKFLYRDIDADLNWETIHKGEYQELFIYKAHLINLMKKYNVNPNISLGEFNSTNYQNIKLCFALINQTDYKYEFITENLQPYVKIIDLLITSVSSPAFFGAYPLPLKDLTNPKYITKLINKIQGHLEPIDPQKRYWSCGTLNPLPFNIIQSQYKYQTVLCLNPFHSLNQKVNQIHTIPQVKIVKKKSQKQVQNRNLKALDLISFWWSKPTKLTPELKQLMFNNIYQSPFSRFYFFIQFSSYRHLLSHVQQRSTLSLNKQNEHRLLSQIIGSTIVTDNQLNESKYYLRVSNVVDQQGQKTQIDCIKSSKIKQNWIYSNEKYLKELQKVVIQQKSFKFLFSFYRMGKDKIEKLNLSIDYLQLKQSMIFLQMVINQSNSVKLNKITLLQTGEIAKKQVNFTQQNKSWCYEQCKRCGQPLKQKANQNYPNCVFCHKKKQYKLCLIVNYDTQEQLQDQPKFFETEVQMPELKTSLFHRYLCCLPCFTRK